MKILRPVLFACALALGLSSCASTPQLATPTPCFKPAFLRGFEVESPDRIRVWDGRQSWMVELRGACPELSEARNLVFSDEMALQQWPTQPWREGFGFNSGWPNDGSYITQSSTLMRVCPNRQSWVHAFDRFGHPVSRGFASFGCRIDAVTPLAR